MGVSRSTCHVLLGGADTTWAGVQSVCVPLDFGGNFVKWRASAKFYCGYTCINSKHMQSYIHAHTHTGVVL